MPVPGQSTVVASKESWNPLGIIRERTRGLHAQLEAGVSLERLTVSRAAYYTMLERYLRVYRPLERLMTQQPPDILALLRWAERPRLARIEKDLAALGGTAEQIGSVPEWTNLPALDDKDKVLGALYVIEGSALGGQFLFREIYSKLGLDQNFGAAFFFGDGERTSAVWRWFVSVLRDEVRSPERAGEAAAEMFHVFQSVLTEPENMGELVL